MDAVTTVMREILSNKRDCLTIAALAVMIVGSGAVNVLVGATLADRLTAALGFSLCAGGWLLFHLCTRYLRRMEW